jgi:hypothetical protein
MRASDTTPAGEWRGTAGWLRRREHGGGPALLYVTGGVTTCVVLAITLLAIVDELWMVAVAVVVLGLSVTAVTAFIALMLRDRDGG